MIKIGDSASLSKTFTANDVQNFADISGDRNPLHIDAEYASKTQFKQRLVHGMLTAGLISAVLGMQLPGPGSVYIHQDLNFRKPVFIDDTITATVTIKKLRAGKPIITLGTVCTNQVGTVVLDGEATLIVPSPKNKKLF